MMRDVTALQRTIGGVLGVLLLIVVVQAFVPSIYVPQDKPPIVEQPCVGEPLEVDYAFNGAYLEPWACQPQCDDGKQRYILYTNGEATQCQLLPGCYDEGEDAGVTCVPELQS